MQRVRFERHEGSGFPLRVVFPDGSWLGVNREHQGLHTGDAHGRITQLLGADQFKAVSPRQFAAAYRKAFGHSIRMHATTATVPRESAVPTAREHHTPEDRESAVPGKYSALPVRLGPVHARDHDRHAHDGSAPQGFRPAGSARHHAEPHLRDPFADHATVPAYAPAPAQSPLRALFYPDPARSGSLGLLLMRVGAGMLLVPHGMHKLVDGARSMAEGLAVRGMPAPFVLAVCATLAESVGGVLIVLGLLTRPAAASACITMLVAWSTMHLGEAQFLGTGKGTPFEYPVLLSVLFLALAVAGPGKYSLDALIFGRRQR
ncbi:DoxX family protein [Chondromyces apiculatus]|uniref:DoxX family protein n=1 Tax=Chondromyces apiculatus DSM 436 TaxID=1192034 RepID=A0A017TIU5_9BACT|nr:DoxX family protein [Chondromyces apiculatus]EYF08770.1 Hypothetical protein CAP_2631 [Chondromyces apiculatus DSM 436]